MMSSGLKLGGCKLRQRLPVIHASNDKYMPLYLACMTARCVCCSAQEYNGTETSTSKGCN